MEVHIGGHTGALSCPHNGNIRFFRLLGFLPFGSANGKEGWASPAETALTTHVAHLAHALCRGAVRETTTQIGQKDRQ